MITGIPCSGKSTVAKKIKEHLKNQEKKVMIISEDEALEQYDEHKNVTLSDSLKEKTLRSELKGQVLRHLTKDTVVILDAQNYIKGYRYELYCASKSVKTTQVTGKKSQKMKDFYCYIIYKSKYLHRSFQLYFLALGISISMYT